MASQRAVVHKSPDVVEVRDNVPLPTLQDDWILVQTKAVALNPTDWKNAQRACQPGAIVGCDYAGVVEAVGKNVASTLKPGDRVAGFVRGGDPYNQENGAFAEHIRAKGGIHSKLPDNMSFEDAATLGVGISTVGQGLYQSLGLPLPPAKVQEPTSILIYGASTATGTLAVQFAKLSGLEVIATASPRNFELLRKLGADQVFDYNEPNVGTKIREATKDKLELVFDCISESLSPDISAAALSSSGGHYSALLPVPNFPRKDVNSRFTLGYTVIGEKYNEQFPANPTDHEYGVMFWKIAERLINSGQIKTHPIEVREGGLHGIPKGLQDLKDGKVSGVKLVYKV